MRTEADSAPTNFRRSSGQRIAGTGYRRGGGFRWLPVVLFALYFGYYWLTNSETVPLTGRSQLVELSREQEMALGARSYAEVLADSPVMRSGAELRLVRDVGQRLVATLGELDPGFDWEFNVIQSQEANAFCMPGGKVAVYTGILPITANPDGLAAVMGHEIAHAIARHGAERMAHQRLAQMGQVATGAAIGDLDPGTQQMVLTAFGAGAKFGLLLPYSRAHESEADYMGLIFAARACFDPREAPRLWQRMATRSAGAPPEFASSHPSHQTRIQQLNAWMPEALEVYQQNCR